MTDTEIIALVRADREAFARMLLKEIHPVLDILSDKEITMNMAYKIKSRRKVDNAMKDGRIDFREENGRYYLNREQVIKL